MKHELPLIDGAFFIDNSTLELLTTCPRALEYSRLFRRISSAAKPSLNFGSAIHLALEWRYRHCKNQPPDALEESEQAAVLSRFFADHVPPEDEYRNLNWAIEVIKHYNQTYQVEPFNILIDKDGQPLVELPFALHLFDYKTGVWGFSGDFPPNIPVYYSGRIDLPVAWDGQTVVIDHKTTSVLGDYFFKDQRVSPQQLGYCWAFEQITGQKVQAFCINAIRSRPVPAKPQGGIDRWWSENFMRHREFIMPHQLEEWKSNTIALVEEFFWHYSRDFFPQKKRWCSNKYGLCSYYDVCDLPPDQRGILLESTLFTENDWTPLKQPSQPLQ
jgi:hypothetical protein